MSNPFGIDVSHDQYNIDWSEAASQVEFASMRATLGTHTVDGYFAENWSGAHEAGIEYVGAYHFLWNNGVDDGVEQAHNFLTQVGKVAEKGGAYDGTIAPILDYESSTKTVGPPPPPVAQAWLDTVEQATGIRPIVYCNLSTANDLGSQFADYPLWLALYRGSGVDTPPEVPPAWQWTFWQCSDKGSVPGIRTKVDINYHNGPLGTGLPAHQDPSHHDPPPSTEHTYTVRAGDSLSKIAAQFHCSLAELMHLNPQIANPNHIEIGQVLRVP